MVPSKLLVVREIAQELDCGNDCYYNSKTDEIIAIPNFLNFSDEEEFQELFKTDLKKIEALESGQSFKIMA